MRSEDAEFAHIGFEFTDDEKKNSDLQFERTRRELKQLADARAPHHCLLILDNVERTDMSKPGLLDPAMITKLDCGDWLHVLATTRLGENELHGAHRDRSFLAIDELPPDDALALIESYQPDGHFRSEAERGAAREIVRLLGNFTLAVESAAVYLGQFANDVTCAAFLARLKKEGLEGLDTAASQSSEGVLHGEKRLGATLQRTLERLSVAERLALDFAAFLPSDQVPLPWLRALVSRTFPEVERDAEPGYPDPWKHILRRLFSLRLIGATDALDADGQPHVVRVHRLLQQLLLNIRSEEERIALQAVVNDVVQFRLTALQEVTEWTDSQWELDPIAALAEMWADQNHPFAGTLINVIGQLLSELAEWAKAEPLLRRGLVIVEQRYGKEHSTVAGCLNDLAILLRATNRLSEAEPLARRALAIFERMNSRGSTDIASALNNLGLILHTMNRSVEAERLFRRALEMKERISGPDSPEVATTLNNLGNLLDNAGRSAKAERLFRRALIIDERTYGGSHPCVARDLSNLALCLKRATRLTQAEPHYRRVLGIYENAYGADHPEVARTLNNLAELLNAAKQPAEAEPLYRRALVIWEQRLPGNHPDLATVLNNLALLLADTKRHAEAEPLFRRALAIEEKNRGMDAPELARYQNNLAQSLQFIGRHFEAEPLLRRALEILLKFQEKTGRRHPQLNTAIAAYESFLAGTGWGEAEVRARLNSVARPFGIQFGGSSSAAAKRRRL